MKGWHFTRQKQYGGACRAEAAVVFLNLFHHLDTGNRCCVALGPCASCSRCRLIFVNQRSWTVVTELLLTLRRTVVFNLSDPMMNKKIWVVFKLTYRDLQLATKKLHHRL